MKLKGVKPSYFDKLKTGKYNQNYICIIKKGGQDV